MQQLSVHGPAPRKRILFVAEAVTLAHVARPVTLAEALNPDSYEVTLAWDPRYRAVFPDLQLSEREIESISTAQFLGALSQGRPLYDLKTLRRYVLDDLRLLEDLRPDVVVGDFRLSLSISARVAGVPYVAIANAYWSPYSLQRFPLPELPWVRWTGVPLAKLLFRVARPAAFAYHSVPLNRLHREYRLRPVGLDLRRVYTDADYTLYADIPEVSPTTDLPATHQYLGPVHWSPAVPPPPWWDSIPGDRPIIYVTLGSSGASGALPAVLRALAELPVYAIAATAGRIDAHDAPDNAFVAEYLPGDRAAERSALVVCNGGSPTTYQALAAGKPVLAIASNMDQHLNMEPVRRLGAGELIRAGAVTVERVLAATKSLLDDDAYSAAARRLSDDPYCRGAPARFGEFISRLTSDATAPENLTGRNDIPATVP